MKFLIRVLLVPVTLACLTVSASAGIWGSSKGGGTGDPMGAWGAPTEVTISGGGVAGLSGEGYYTIDTNSDDPTDDLNSITGLDIGDEIIIAPADDGRTIVVVHGLSLVLCRGANFTMNNEEDRMVLQGAAGGVVVEITRSSGGD